MRMHTKCTWVANKGNAFQHTDGSDDEGKVGRNLEGEIKGDLSQVSCKVPASHTGTTHQHSDRQTAQWPEHSGKARKHEVICVSATSKGLQEIMMDRAFCLATSASSDCSWVFKADIQKIGRQGYMQTYDGVHKNEFRLQLGSQGRCEED